MPAENFPPARSALNLRLALAVGGGVLCLVLGLLVVRALGVLPAVPLFLLAVVAVVDVVVIRRRKAQRSAAHRGADHRHDSLFE
jgi:membrane protein implicated in regulation of membrane protease activity